MLCGRQDRCNTASPILARGRVYSYSAVLLATFQQHIDGAAVCPSTSCRHLVVLSLSFSSISPLRIPASPDTVRGFCVRHCMVIPPYPSRRAKSCDQPFSLPCTVECWRLCGHNRSTISMAIQPLLHIRRLRVWYLDTLYMAMASHKRSNPPAAHFCRTTLWYHPARKFAAYLNDLVFFFQTVVYRIGYGSAGYERFFVCIAPLLGVIAAQGLHYLFEEAPALRRDMHTNNLVLGSLKQTAMPIVILILLVGQTILITWWLFQPNPPVGRLHVIASWLVAFLAIVMTIRRRRPNRILWTALIVLLTAITFLYTTRWVRPDQVDTAFEALWADAAHWYATSEWQRQPVLALHPFFWIAANRDPYTRLDRFNWDQLDPQSASLGTIILWDSDLGSKKRRCSVDFFNADQFRIIRSWETFHEDTKFQIIAFEKVNTLPPCDAS
jgi:hypothetical protein